MTTETTSHDSASQDDPTLASFLERKDVRPGFHRYAIDAFGAMAQGLFASLLIGTILSTIGDLTGVQMLTQIGGYAKAVAGPAMAIAIGAALSAPPLVLYSLAAVGYAANEMGGAGGPLAVFVIAIVAAEMGKLVSKETRVDILVTPGVTVGVGCVLSILVAPWVGTAASSLGNLVMWATDLQPFLMGMIVSVVVGAALTLPISSAAICAALGLTGLAGGAALAGCCAQMVGYAAASFADNGWAGVVSQGLGTSMLQVPNIFKKPITWVPALVASAITGPVATVVFNVQQNGAAIASGMGTCGLVGPIGLYTGWIADGIVPGAKEWLAMALVCVVLPAAIAWLVAFALRRAGLIEPGDMKVD